MPPRDLILKKSTLAVCGTAMLIAAVWLNCVYGGSNALVLLITIGMLTLIASGEYEGKR